MRPILVTGGVGYISFHTCAELLNENSNINDILDMLDNVCMYTKNNGEK
ncbi:MAG: hypothetical protein HFI49_03855 [Bacilli bacterium]|jgi:UDP-glucose 4-epimerase|nr:hypothetical protein [Bacilli bacterium]